MLPERLNRKVIYSGPRANLYADHVRMPAGGVVEDHLMLDAHFDAVAALVMERSGDILFVEAYRYPTGTLSWEIPAGGVEPGESPLEAAAREVMEETGYATQNHELVYSFYPINGLSNKVFHIVRCQAEEQVGIPDPDEVRSVSWKSEREVREMVASGVFQDGFTLVGLLLQFCLEEGRSGTEEGR